jgi:endoglucanase
VNRPRIAVGLCLAIALAAGALPALAAGASRGTAGATVAVGPPVVIRVDQVGYPTNAAKAAEVMTSQPQPAGVAWQLLRQSGTGWVLADQGRTTTDLGAWNARYAWVWAVTGFSDVKRTGRYRLVLAGDRAVSSPAFAIEPAASLYARALANAVSFYENEQDGPDFVKTALRTAPGDLNDGDAMTYTKPPMNGNGNFKGSLAPYATGISIDADGGWFDAGDYLKFVETTSYVVAIMLQGIHSFPSSMGAAARTSFVGEARFGLDFLQRMWDEQTKTLYFQVGIGEANNYYYGDHDIWRLPQADDDYMGTNVRYLYIRHPPVLRAGPPGSGISPNIAGRLAADFALCYRVFATTDRTFADSCLRSAETVYSLSDTAWKGHLLTAAPWGFYPETSWQDDMMLGATELSLAVAQGRNAGDLPSGLPVRSPAVYLRDAGTFAHEWVTGPEATSDTLNLYDVSALGDYELDLAMSYEHDSDIGVTPAQLVGNLNAQIRKSIGISDSDPFRFGFKWDQWDTTTHGAGLSIMANEYDALAHRPVYARWAQRWLDDILGSNAWGISLIVGDGTTFPTCMQHQIANLVGSHNGTPPVLAGAAVEGPNSFAATGTVPNMKPCNTVGPNREEPFAAFNGQGAVYKDNVQSYSTNEPAIDLTSLTPLAFAWQIAAAKGLGTAPPA